MGRTAQLCAAVETGQVARAGDKLQGVEVGTVGERGGAAIESHGPGETENGDRGEGQHDQFGGAEEGLAGDQVPDAAPSPRSIGGGAELAAQTAGKDRAPASSSRPEAAPAPADSRATVTSAVCGLLTSFQNSSRARAKGAVPNRWQTRVAAGARRSRWTASSSSGMAPGVTRMACASAQERRINADEHR